MAELVTRQCSDQATNVPTFVLRRRIEIAAVFCADW
jgi:hypothetical protein